jgi:hypothetical protein
MHPDGARNSPEVALGSQDPFPMDAASVPSEMPCPRVNARGVGRGRGRGRGQNSQATTGSRANGVFSFILRK